MSALSGSWSSVDKKAALCSYWPFKPLIFGKTYSKAQFLVRFSPNTSGFGWTSCLSCSYFCVLWSPQRWSPVPKDTDHGGGILGQQEGYLGQTEVSHLFSVHLQDLISN